MGTGPSLAAGDLSSLTGMASLTGTCDQLIVAGSAMSAHCNPMILQTMYTTGRTGFTVTAGDNGVTITFSGMEGAKPDRDSQLQSVDMVILNLAIEGVDPTVQEVTGSCAYSNPYKGPMTISCQATDPDSKAYLLQFRTDGSEPRFTDLAGGNEAPTSPRSARDAGAAFRQELATEPTAVGWVVQPLDAPGIGCLASLDLNPKQTIMVYANGNETFEINIWDEDWNFPTTDPVEAELRLDGKIVPLSSIVPRNEQVLTLFGGAEEEGYQAVFAASHSLSFKIGNQTISGELRDTGRVTDDLWACVAGQ